LRYDDGVESTYSVSQQNSHTDVRRKKKPSSNYVPAQGYNNNNNKNRKFI